MPQNPPKVIWAGIEWGPNKTLSLKLCQAAFHLTAFTLGLTKYLTRISLITWLPYFHSSTNSKSEIREESIRSEMKQLNSNKNSSQLLNNKKTEKERF